MFGVALRQSCFFTVLVHVVSGGCSQHIWGKKMQEFIAEGFRQLRGIHAYRCGCCVCEVAGVLGARLLVHVLTSAGANLLQWLTILSNS